MASWSCLTREAKTASAAAAAEEEDEEEEEEAPPPLLALAAASGPSLLHSASASPASRTEAKQNLNTECLRTRE